MNKLTPDNNFAAGYCRVSTEEQANKGLSLDVQEEACKVAIVQDGFGVLIIIRDEGKSGGTLNRPGIQEIVKLIAGKKIRALYAISSDRLARNTMDYLYLRDLCKKNGVTIRYIYQPQVDDSAMSQTMDTVMASFNEMQRLVISEKVKKTLYAKAEAGYFPGPTPPGYRNMDNPKAGAEKVARKIIAPDLMMGFLMTEAFNLYATGNFNGYDLNDLMYEKGLRARNGSKLSPSRFYELLKNRLYIGEVHWGAVHVERGWHEPLIDRETFNVVQAVMAGNNRHACRRRKYSWLLNGFVFCYKHQRRYTAEWHHQKGLAYYHCPNKSGCGKYLEATTFEAKIAEKFKDLEFENSFVERIIEKVRAVFLTRRQEYAAKRQGLINQKTALFSKRKVAEDKLLERVMQDDDFTRVRQEIDGLVENIDTKLAELDKQKETKVDVAQEILRFTRNIYDAYMKASPALKRHYLAFFWDRFEVEEGVIIRSHSTLLFRELLALKQLSLKKAETKKAPNMAPFSEVIIRSSGLRG